jgi:hypothetical protein
MAANQRGQYETFAMSFSSSAANTRQFRPASSGPPSLGSDRAIRPMCSMAEQKISLPSR